MIKKRLFLPPSSTFRTLYPAASPRHENKLNNVHQEADGDFSQIERIHHTGALLIGTLDRFTYGEPQAFLQNINRHFPNAQSNTLIFIQNTGHTYQQKEQEMVDKVLDVIQAWGM